MPSQTTSQVLAIFAIVFLLVSPASRTQETFSAFATCTDRDGNAALCTHHQVGILEGYSSSEEGAQANLAPRMFTAVTAEQVCATSPVPDDLVVELFNPNLQPDDRLYFTDIIVSAYDANGVFIPEVPVTLIVMSETGVLSMDPAWDFIEVSTAGSAHLSAMLLCEELPGTGGMLPITVTP
ncbi:MAG: hypothetical protein RL120_14190 [Gammaproteobacteria bacterium]